jgi:hypothetical protein
MRAEKGRVGQFFLVIGLILLTIFFFTAQGEHPAYGYFIFGALVTFFGGFLIWRYRKPRPQAERFRTVNRMRTNNAERKAKKAAKKAAKK